MKVPIWNSSGPNRLPVTPGAVLDVHNHDVDLNASPVPYSMRPDAAPSDQTPAGAAPIYSPSAYADGNVLTITQAANASVLVLQRPVRSQRVNLIIVNDTIGTIRFNLDAPATATIGIPILPGGNAFFDVFVPQNDIYIFWPNIGNVQVMYANANITSPSAVLNANQ